MSTTRTYALQSRPDAGVATQPQPQNISILRRDEPLSARDLPPHMPGSLLHCPRAGPGQSQLALARGQLGPRPIGSGQGRARANPDPPITKYSTNVQKNMY